MSNNSALALETVAKHLKSQTDDTIGLQFLYTYVL